MEGNRPGSGKGVEKRIVPGLNVEASGDAFIIEARIAHKIRIMSRRHTKSENPLVSIGRVTRRHLESLCLRARLKRLLSFTRGTSLPVGYPDVQWRGICHCEESMPGVNRAVSVLLSGLRFQRCLESREAVSRRCSQLAPSDWGAGMCLEGRDETLEKVDEAGLERAEQASQTLRKMRKHF